MSAPAQAPWDRYKQPPVSGGGRGGEPWEKFSGDQSANADLQPEPTPAPGAASRLGTGVYNTTIAPLAEAIKHPIEAAKNLVRTGLAAGKTAFTGNPFDSIDLVRPIVEPIAQDIQGGNYAGAAGQVAGNLISMFGVPAAMKGLGIGAEVGARPLVKSALGLPGKAEAFGATPAKAVLEETSGVRPSSIALSGRTALKELNSELESNAATAKGPLSLAPARATLEDAANKAAGANSIATPREIAPMQRQLTIPESGFAGNVEFAKGANTPITINQNPTGLFGPNGQALTKPSLIRGPSPEPVVAEEQTPLTGLKMKRQFDQDFIRNWNPQANTKGQLGVARSAYHDLASEVNRTVPGAPELNQRISSLIPAVDRAEAVNLSAGPGERILNRVARPTGALAPALLGLHEGGVPGMVGAITGQETLSSPVVKMMGARTLFNGGKALQKIAPAGAAIPLTRRPQREQQP